MKREVAQRKIHYIPAAPGYHVAYYVHAESPDYPSSYDLVPIIGWQIVHDGDENKDIGDNCLIVVVNPVTVEGPQEDGISIAYPNGKVCTPDVTTYPSVDSWLEACAIGSRL